MRSLAAEYSAAHTSMIESDLFRALARDVFKAMIHARYLQVGVLSTRQRC